MKKEDIYSWCKESAFAGKDYLFIKKEVDQLDCSEEEKIQIMVKADEYIAHYQTALQERDKALQQMLIGLIFLFMGAGINLYSHFAIGKHYLLLDGLTLIGFFVFREAYIAYQIPLEEMENPLEQTIRKIKR